ncbi:MAG: Rpn family recombination-promoting nuclease/putative transposase [Lachnospiraceae bacterium]|nr:Rpn family recombination-promoting nuclease/putative transposase [Lachnospiraceae bacterium]
MKKQLKNLTIKDNFMFAAVMLDEDNCKGFLERALQIQIDHVEVSTEKNIVYHPEYKGVRLDVYAKDENNTHYNVEMQVSSQSSLGLRSRYYQSHMDMEMLLSGSEYAELPNSYVIFICDFDPFGEKKYKYTFEMECKETKKAKLQDKRNIIFLSTKGRNADEVPQELVHFLKFVEADLKESQKDFQDEYVRKLQGFVKHIKQNREMEEKYMLFEELLKDERKEGEHTGMVNSLIMFLENFGEVPEELKEKVSEERNQEVLKGWIQTAAKSKSLEEFIAKM